MKPANDNLPVSVRSAEDLEFDGWQRLDHAVKKVLAGLPHSSPNKAREHQLRRPGGSACGGEQKDRHRTTCPALRSARITAIW